jgi:hypothetical protein
MITRLALYDFDGTLANTPMPAEGRMLWKQVTGQDYPHMGWWGRKESLNTDVFDIKAYPSIASALKKDMARPDTYTAILTSRLKKLTPEIENILQQNGLSVDEISTVNDGGEKDLRIKNFLKRFPDVKEVDVYDDRDKEFNVLLPLKNELTDVVDINVYAVDKGSIKLLESVNSIKTLINVEIKRYLKNQKS